MSEEQNGGAKAKPKPKPAPADGPTRRKAEPRDYVVYREVSVKDFESSDGLRDALLAAGAGANPVVLVKVGEANALNPKVARIEVAKKYVPDDDLKTDDPDSGGVELNAVVKSAIENGKAPVRLVVEQKLV